MVIIPPNKDISSDAKPVLRVAAYCRVSTLEETQTGIFELQCQHYREYITNTPGWELVDIYSDEGISGTSMTERIGLMNIIDACKANKIDLIITKSVIRFAGNTRDCLQVVRQLKQLNPPIAVFFETENLNTLETKNEFTLGILSLVAQGEVGQKSSSIKWAFVERAKKGIPSDCLMQKTYTVDCFSHKSKINRGEVTQYYLKNSHIPIISPEQWKRAQQKGSNHTRIKTSKPVALKQKVHISRIKSGLMKGIIIINPN